MHLASPVRLFRRSLLLVALLFPLLCSRSAQGADFRYVQFWAGDPSGTKAAVVVINWADGNRCVVWGYRWNGGMVAGRTMLEAIKAVDPRLFERETGGLGNGYPYTIYGLGYDRDGDGFPGLNTLPDDASTPLDPDDSYREGWQTGGFWYIRQSERSAGNPWETAAPVASANIDDGGAFGAHFAANFAALDPPDPATCEAAPLPNTPPTVTTFALAGLEDQPVSFTAADFSSAFADNDGDNLVAVQLVALPSNGTLRLDTALVTHDQIVQTSDLEKLVYTPNPDYNTAAEIPDQFRWNGSDGRAYAANPASVTIQVAPVNDPPSFVGGSNPPDVASNAGPQVLAGWATAIQAGPATATDEAGQTLNFILTADNPDLFTTLPAITPDGTLSYTPAANQRGSTQVTVTLHDDGGREHGGIDTSLPQTFRITVKPLITDNGYHLFVPIVRAERQTTLYLPIIR